MRRRRLVPGDPNSVVRNVEAESESDESCKMIRATSRYLHAHVRCQQNPHERARKMRAAFVAMHRVWRACRVPPARDASPRIARSLPAARDCGGKVAAQPRAASGTTARSATPV